MSSVSSLSGFLGPLPRFLGPLPRLLRALQFQMQLSANPFTNLAAMEVVRHLPVDCSYHAAAVAAHCLLQPLCSNSLTPTHAPLLVQELWGCCTSCLWVAAAVLQQLQSAFCCSFRTAAHCSQPPPCYQSGGYGSASPAARWLLWPCCSSCSLFPAAAFVLHLTAANPHPVTNPGAIGVLHQLPVGCSCRAAAAATHFLLQLLC